MARIQDAIALQQPFAKVFPQPMISRRDPTINDKRFSLGQTWINTSSNQVWTLTSVTGGSSAWDLNSVEPGNVNLIFGQSPLLTTSENSGGPPTGDTEDVNLMYLQKGVAMEQFFISPQTIIAPRMTDLGLLISLDIVPARGVEYNFGAVRENSCPSFTIGTSPAFFFEVGMTIAELLGANPYMIGFRKSAPNNQNFLGYTDYAVIGMFDSFSTTNISTISSVNDSGPTGNVTNNAWGGNGANVLLRILVNGSGAVTYTINGKTPSAGGSSTFDTTDVVCPFISLQHGATPGAVYITSMKYGFQT